MEDYYLVLFSKSLTVGDYQELKALYCQRTTMAPRAVVVVTLKDAPQITPRSRC